jgi:polar amino acid transport system substrate-binding protein
MKKAIRITAVILALVMALGCLAACGAKTEEGNGSEKTQGSEVKTQAVKVIDIPLTEEEYAFGVSKKQPELLSQLNEYIAKIKADGTLDEIMNSYFGDGEKRPGVASATENSSADQLIIATNAEFPPFEQVEGTLYYGIAIDLMDGFAKSIGKELVVKNIDFDSVLTTVDAGYADIAASGLTKNEAREAYVTFSDSYYNASQMIIVKGDNTAFDECKTVEDMEKVLNTFTSSTTIGSQNGTTGKLYVEGDKDFGFAGLKASSKGYANGALAVQDMLNGNIDLVIIDEAPAKAISANFNAVS